MSKKCGVLTVLLATLLFASFANADSIKKIEVVTTQGSDAYFDSSDDTLTWSGGSSGTIYWSDYSSLSFDSATVTATFENLTDTSSGELMSGSFSNGSWSVELSDSDGAEVTFSGGLASGLNYNEEETAVDSDALQGTAIINVDTLNYSTDYFSDIQWGNDSMLGGLVSSVSFPDNTNLTDYDSDYSSENLTLTFYSDETQVPEPATIGLLGLAGAFVIRKRK